MAELFGGDNLNFHVYFFYILCMYCIVVCIFLSIIKKYAEFLLLEMFIF